MSQQEAWEDERGFTLVEMVLIVVLMGIMIGVAMQSYFGIVEGRRVDSATNQLVADLRLAHTKATNHLEVWQVVLTDDSSTYTVGLVASPTTRDLDEEPAGHEVVTDTGATITFEADGSATLPGDASSATFTVRPAEVYDGAPTHDIEINAATSRIQVDP